jgi:ppGpp synthetase/RelA/SpoT-type nucleotidyltranferase
MSATPLPTSEYHAAVLNRKYTKRDRGVSLYSCDHIKLCETCVIVNTLIGMRMPLQVLEDSPQVTDYLAGQEDFSINTFVDKLPPLLAQICKK